MTRQPSTAASSALTLSDAPDQAVSEPQVATDGMATALREGRGNSEGKVVLCHRTDNGYHFIDVSVNAEPAHRVGTVVAAADGVLYVDSDESFYLGVN